MAANELTKEVKAMAHSREEGIVYVPDSPIFLQNKEEEEQQWVLTTYSIGWGESDKLFFYSEEAAEKAEKDVRKKKREEEPDEEFFFSIRPAFWYIEINDGEEYREEGPFLTEKEAEEAAGVWEDEKCMVEIREGAL